VDNNQAIPDTSKPTLTPTPDDVRPPAPDTVAPDVWGGPKGRS
jgi:hypothetical protein